MRALLLLTPGRESPTSLPQLAKRGYEVSLVDTRVSLACLTDSWRDKRDFNVKSMKEVPTRLRAAWVYMLRRFVNADYYTVFGEADCFPLVSSRRLHQWIDEAPRDAEVLKLSALGGRSIWDSIWRENPDYDSIGIKWHRIEHDASSWYTAGTHAMWVKPSAREKLADLYASCYMPVDNVLSPADKHNVLRVYRASHNIMTQAPYKIEAVNTFIKAYNDSPPDLLVVVVVTDDDDDDQIDPKLLGIKDIIPAGCRLIVSIPSQYDCSLEEAYARPDSCTYLHEYLPPLYQEDIDKYPVTVFLSLSNEYPHNYLTDIALRYQCLDFSYPQYGFCGTNAPVYKGTLAVATASLDTTKVKDVSRFNCKFMHYDLSTWNATDKIKYTGTSNICIDAFAESLELGEGMCRVYNEDVICSSTGEHGVIQERTDDTVSILWDADEQEVVYRKTSSGIFDKL